MHEHSCMAYTIMGTDRHVQGHTNDHVHTCVNVSMTALPARAGIQHAYPRIFTCVHTRNTQSKT